MCSHLLYFDVAGRAGCHERWDVFEFHGKPRLLELPRWLPVELDGTPPDGCHGAQRLGKALWFHDNGQPPTHIVHTILFYLFVDMWMWFDRVLISVFGLDSYYSWPIHCFDCILLTFNCLYIGSNKSIMNNNGFDTLVRWEKNSNKHSKLDTHHF